MTRTAAVVLVLGLLGLAGGLFFLSRRDAGPAKETENRQVVTERPLESTSPDSPSLLLYFMSPRDGLRAETRALEALPESPEDLVVRALGELFSGSVDPDLQSPLGPEVEVVSVVVTADGVVYVDLRAAEQGTPPASGSRLEMLCTYSLVNTVLGNLVAADAVVILWNGTQLETFSGHLDLGRPLRFRESLVETSES